VSAGNRIDEHAPGLPATLEPASRCESVRFPERTIKIDWFWLYRPSAPSPRAQSVQIVHAAHAMAQRGHRVELWVEGDQPAEQILEYYGLEHAPTLRIGVLPRARTLASLGYRAAFAAWVRRTGGQGVALARRKKHADWALRWFGARFRLLLEVHEVDSRMASDPAEARRWHALEDRVLRGSWGVIANAPGTLELLRQAHPALPPAVAVHNAARPGLTPRGVGQGIGIAGSVRPYKDPQTVARAAASLPWPVTWVGADRPVEAPVRTEPALPPREVPARLQRFRTLLLPLSPGLFGEQLTSPLKLWDALQSGVPLVAADTAALADAAAGAYVPYTPGDPASLVQALRRAHEDEALRAQVTQRARERARTWAQRAGEVEAFVERHLFGGS
jgi:glycosyltransferase involved in cell wall biosynthesis